MNTWDAELYFASASEGAILETSMAGAKIDTYNIPENLVLPIKMPIPPEYGKPVRLRLTTLKGNIEPSLIKIIPPGDEESFTINTVERKSE